MQRIMDLASIGAIDGGGCARLALTDEDAAGRDLVVGWMHELGMTVTTDVIGNVIGTWNVGKGLPVMTGSHIDTVRTGGKYDGNLGVLAGLEVIQTLQEASIIPSRPISVGIFTNEEGSRFAPDMLGSLVYVGGLPIEDALDIVGIDGARVGDELERIGYNGATPCPGFAPHAFVELHIEQGPVLERTNIKIGAVTGVQGISWQEITITGQSNHAGTTPMSMRRDPGYVAAKIAVFLRDLADRYGGHQVCTVGKVDLFPNLVNVIPAKAVMTLDVRNTDENVLAAAEQEISQFIESLSKSEGVQVASRALARFEPVIFHPQVIDIVESVSAAHSPSVTRMPSGAGHDAQMLARVCPSAMIFVPSVEGISHNPAEFTDPDDLVMGSNILLQVLIELSQIEEFDS
jgi:N-carbamoyl-L-amino-acid hydrolase